MSAGSAGLAADAERVGSVEALGLDETLFGRPPFAYPTVVHLDCGCDRRPIPRRYKRPGWDRLGLRGLQR